MSRAVFSHHFIFDETLLDRKGHAFLTYGHSEFMVRVAQEKASREIVRASESLQEYLAVERAYPYPPRPVGWQLTTTPVLDEEYYREIRIQTINVLFSRMNAMERLQVWHAELLDEFRARRTRAMLQLAAAGLPSEVIRVALSYDTNAGRTHDVQEIDYYRVHFGLLTKHRENKGIVLSHTGSLKKAKYKKLWEHVPAESSSSDSSDTSA
jgi:hypothetical protein